MKAVAHILVILVNFDIFSARKIKYEKLETNFRSDAISANISYRNSADFSFVTFFVSTLINSDIHDAIVRKFQEFKSEFCKFVSIFRCRWRFRRLAIKTTMNSSTIIWIRNWIFVDCQITLWLPWWWNFTLPISWKMPTSISSVHLRKWVKKFKKKKKLKFLWFFSRDLSWAQISHSKQAPWA
jgi:hypothetical protein